MRTLGRRDLLRAGGAGILALGLPGGFVRRAFAGEEATPTLVVIYLRGGMDALNVVVPHGDRHYAGLRPTLAIAPEDADDRPGVIRLDAKFGLHPALAALKPYWDLQRLAPVVNAGSPHPTRSHFDAQDFMEYAAPGMRTVRDGWLNRYLAQTHRETVAAETLRALAMQGLLPRSLRGTEPVLAVPDRDVLANAEVLELFEPVYAEKQMGESRDDDAEELRKAGRDTVDALARFRGIVQGRESRPEAAYPPGPLGAKLRAIARVIRAGIGLEIAAVDVGGWDTHANQGSTDGTMPRLLKALADSIAAFADDLGPRLERTLIVTMTEFGRTCRENGNFGTDHGHGGLMLLLGGGVRGGRIHGRWTDLGERDLYEGRDLKVTTDFRDVFAEILREHFRFKPPPDFFPGFRPGRVRGLFA